MSDGVSLWTAEDVKQLRASYREVAALMDRIGIGADVGTRRVFEAGERTEDVTALSVALADAAVNDHNAGRIPDELADRVLSFAEQILARAGHRLGPVVGRLMLDEVGEELRKRTE